MAAYKLYEHLNSPANVQGPAHQKEFIAIHWYGDPNTAGDVHATARYLSTATHASVNYVAGDDSVYCLVSPTNVAYAQGDGANGYGNTRGISIECDPRCTAQSRETVAQLIAQIRDDFNTTFSLRPHNHFTGTQCPGVWEAWMPWLHTRAEQIRAEKRGVKTPAPVVPAPQPQPAGKVELVYAPRPVPAGPYVANPHWKWEPLKGDKLEDVARHFKTTVAGITAFNGLNVKGWELKNGDDLWNPEAYYGCWVVEKGDTLSGVVKYYNDKYNHKITVKDLQYVNGINNPNTETKLGMRLAIPYVK